MKSSFLRNKYIFGVCHKVKITRYLRVYNTLQIVVNVAKIQFVAISLSLFLALLLCTSKLLSCPQHFAFFFFFINLKQIRRRRQILVAIYHLLRLICYLEHICWQCSQIQRFSGTLIARSAVKLIIFTRLLNFWLNFVVSITQTR